jgi:hypothetical protein
MTKQELRKLIREYVEEALALKRAGDKLMVVSDLEDRKAQSSETFRNKDKLKAAGFKWDASINSWTIPSDEFDSAKKTLSALNKVEYVVEKIEDLAEFVQDADNVSRKAELSQKIDGYIKNLTQDLDEVSASDEIRNFLAFQAKIKSRSFHNTLLIYLQNKRATHVEGFRTWQEKFGRQVKKGAKAITIFAPISVKKDEPEDINNPDIDKQIKQKNQTWFRPVNVFDISDTEPIPGKEHLYVSAPKWHADDTLDEKADKVYNYAMQLANELGINVQRGDAKGGEMGYAAGDHINITSNIDGVNKAGTFIHEIAHELLHFKKGSVFYIDDETLTKQDKEIQAESVSYIVLKHYDLPAKHQATYLTLWKTNQDALKKNLGIIKKVSDFIIQKIDEIAAEDPANKQTEKTPEEQPEQK